MQVEKNTKIHNKFKLYVLGNVCVFLLLFFLVIIYFTYFPSDLYDNGQAL